MLRRTSTAPAALVFRAGAVTSVDAGHAKRKWTLCWNLNPMTTLTDTQLHDLARIGAIARLRELDEEAAGLRQMFRGLKKTQGTAPESAAPASPLKPRKRKKMSPAARKAVGVRMKLYWAKKRGEAPAEAAAEVTETADATTPVAPAKNKKKPTKKAKKASSPKKAKGTKKG
jgi:hypothetical protein